MDTAIVDFSFIQGEDWTTQIFFTDVNDKPIPLQNKLKMDIRSGVTNQLVHTLETSDVPPPLATDVPDIVISPDIGLIQLHIGRAVTETFSPGTYNYDLFAKTTDGWEYAGQQVTALIRGKFRVIRRFTEDFE